MSEFIQLHILTSYPPANLNRDDLGRPKTAMMGGVDRLRVSSQSLKRAWRISDLFQSAMRGHVGTRTKRIGQGVYQQLVDTGVQEKKALEWAKEIAGQFGVLKKDKKEPLNELAIEQLVHISQAEQQAIDDLASILGKEQRAPQAEELNLLRDQQQAVDISLFGRMLAAKPSFNVEAACQVAHAITVHPVVIEDDYFTAVDDLNDRSEDAGAAHIGETGFAAGLFYSYICINKSQLIENLGGDTELAGQAVRALTETAVKVAPKGKQNSFASRAYASYVLAERGAKQPRSLAVAFLKPVNPHSSDDYANDAISALESQQRNFDQVYGDCADARYSINVITGEGRINELLDFVSQ